MSKALAATMAALVVTIFSMMSIHEVQAAFGLFGSHKKIRDVDGRIEIPLNKVNDGKAHYFQYESNNTSVRFFVIKSRDGVIRAAFDACDVCFYAKKGYTQDGEFMICNNCGRRFHSSRINIVEGGCNPAPLRRQVVGDKLVILAADVVPGGRYF